MGAAIVAAAPVITAIGSLLIGGAAAKQAFDPDVPAPAPVAPQAEKVEPIPIPEIKKKIEAAPEEAKEKARKSEIERRKRRIKTRLTGPRGVLTEAPVVRKTLLGE